MPKKLKACPVCTQEVAKSAKLCPHCGKKLKMGWFLKGIIGIVGLIIIVAVLSPSKEEKFQQLTSTLEIIANAQPENISPTSELAAIFKMDSKYTDIQRDKAEKEIIGKVIQWKLPVYEVNKQGDGYIIQTSGDDAIMWGTPMVGAFIKVYPRNNNDVAYIENLKTDDWIECKGKIKGTTMRNIDIEPAILIH